MHKASAQLEQWIYEQSYEGKPLYAIKADIHHYFASINHGVLKRLLERAIADEQLLSALLGIIDSGGKNGVGLPVGNLTSQLFANLYLNELDIFVKESLHARYYIRYMDDFIILSPRKEELEEMLAKIEAFLRNILQIELNPKTTILNCKNNVNFVGYRTWAEHKKLRKSSVKNMRLKIRLYRHGKISRERLERAFISWYAHARHADTWALRKKIANEVSAAIKEKEH